MVVYFNGYQLWGVIFQDWRQDKPKHSRFQLEQYRSINKRPFPSYPSQGRSWLFAFRFLHNRQQKPFSRVLAYLLDDHTLETIALP